MRKSVMNMKIFCVAVGLMTASTWAQVPIFKLWVTEVYEVNPDGSYTAKCGAICDPPTQDLPPGIALPGDLINIEVTVEGWDASTDAGECNVNHEVCSVSAQDCQNFHCTGLTHGLCNEDGDCFFPGTCQPDKCQKTPLVGTFTWTIDSSTYSNGGESPGLAPARLPCTSNGTCLGGDNDGEPCEPANGNADCSVGGICERSFDCACAYTQVLPAFPDGLNDCADFAAFPGGGFCTCLQATCDDNTCSKEAAAYFDLSVIPGYLFFAHNAFEVVDFSSLDYSFAGASFDSPAGVPEQLFKCNAGNQAICNVDADCALGTCELFATSPYYLGTLLLEVTGDSCGVFAVDLIQDLVGNLPFFTSLSDSAAVKLPTPIVEALLIDLGAAVPCPPSNLCETDCSSCSGGPCVCTQIECPPEETCVDGLCVPVGGCDFSDLARATWADADPLAAVPFDRPGDCAIDAREPHAIGDLNAREGWDRIVLRFNCDPTDLAATLRPSRFPVETNPVEVSPPSVPPGGFEANAFDQTITIHLDRSISPGFFTCITHLDSPNRWCAGYLPADASQDGLSSASDVNTLINSINLVPGEELPVYATDINRSGVTTGADILRLIDLLNGAGDFSPWIAQALPDCPSAP